jgi:hypothetical protein
MTKSVETTLKAFVDGFGCMTVTDVSETDKDIVNLLNEESPWEVIDGVDKLPKGHYLITLHYWWEDNFPESGAELCVDWTGHEALVTEDFQQRVMPWMDECFGLEISGDKQERNHRFLEEALELVQACDCTDSEAHQLVDYVYGRPTGEKPQEVGGVMVTLAALCLAQQMDMHDAGEVELARIWTKVDQIRAKQATKPTHSPLPQAVDDDVLYCSECGKEMNNKSMLIITDANDNVVCSEDCQDNSNFDIGRDR